MHNKLLSITQLAKLRNLTSETLRYYDRINLIKPNYVDPNTKYRYYSILQYEELGTVKELRQLGMCINDITSYFNDRNFQKSIEIFEKYQETLHSEIREKIELEKVLNKKVEFLKQLNSLSPVNTITELTLPDRYMITFDEPTGGPHELALAVTELESHLNEIAPIVASDRVGAYGNDSILDESQDYIPLSPFIFVEDNDVQSSLKKLVPGGLYLSMYYDGDELERYHPSFDFIKEYMSEHNLCLNGDIYQIFKIDVTLTSYLNETLMEIQVPVKKI
ncbi:MULTISPECIES: MerR family transcriptional regulator [unclassified Clostridioides]|uniref:MerR family transcriptional regulator n=1 Tax=unclassified Clostridioides TaxID=2635829 RepID=UPI001D0FD4C6|nr:MerR HTH family regulatory protein [Clostridioides difficile]